MTQNMLYIWNPSEILEKHAAATQGYSLVQSDCEFERLSSSDEPDSVYLLLELKWGQGRRSEWRGLTCLRDLRVKLKWRCPVFLCSALPQNRLLKLGNKTINILKTPGHAFIQLPHDVRNPALTPENKRLSANLLADINYHFFDLQGMVDEVFHNLKSKASSHEHSKIEEGFDQLYPILPEAHTELDQLKARLLEKLKNDPSQPPIKHIANIKAEVIPLLPVSDTDQNPFPDIHHWQVLCIDDNPQTLKTLEIELAKRGISTQLASNGEEAFDILKKDYQGQLEKEGKNDTFFPHNSITVVVCDLRFIDENGQWDYWQGWDIVDHIYEKMDNFVSFFVLTSKKGAIVKRARQNKKVKIAAFAKEDCLHQNSPEAFNLFAHRIREEGEKMFETLISSPSGKIWRNPWKGRINYPLINYYRHHRLSDNYFQKETWINSCTESYLEEAEKVKDNRFFKAQKKIGKLSFSFKFKSGQDKYPPDQKNMDKFYLKLIGRRIALGLHLKAWKNDDISSILKHQEIREEKEDRQLFSSYLALSTNLGNEIPDHLLIEERLWIEEVVGYSLDALERGFYQVLGQQIEGFQDTLRRAGCGDDFVDQDEITLGNTGHAKSLLDKIVQLAINHHCAFDLRKMLQELNDYPKFRPYTQRLDFSHYLQRLSAKK